LGVPRRRSLQVAERPFELRLLLAESGDVIFDQSLGLIGLGHVVMVLSGLASEDGMAVQPMAPGKRGLKVGAS
jgi:hypothetical protein